MTNEQAEIIEKKFDAVLEIIRSLETPINVLNELLIEAENVTKARRLNKTIISQNDRLEKFNSIGSRKILMTLRSVAVVKNSKRNFKRVR